jgi:hypothetical protein
MLVPSIKSRTTAWELLPSDWLALWELGVY